MVGRPAVLALCRAVAGSTGMPQTGSLASTLKALTRPVGK